MDFVVNKGELFKQLQYVQGVVERKTTIPILSNFLLETSGNKLEVTATDLDVTVQCSCPASIKVSGALTVSARKLFDIVRLLPDSSIHFKSANQWVQITCERSKFKVASLSKDNFPSVPTVEEAKVVLPSDPLRYMINRCIYAITQEESRYTLNGALIILKPQSITLVTTDGHRLVFISRDLEIKGVSREKRALIPRKTLAELSKLAADPVESVEFGSSENHLFFRAAGRLLISRVLTGQFPSYEMVIPKTNDKQATLSTFDFSDALKRVAIMADEQSHAVRLSLRDDQLDIFSTTSEVGEAKETLPASYQGEPLEIGFNARYILDFLSNLESEQVQIDLKDGETQGLLKPSPSGDYDHQYVVMPVKL